MGEVTSYTMQQPQEDTLDARRESFANTVGRPPPVQQGLRRQVGTCRATQEEKTG